MESRFGYALGRQPALRSAQDGSRGMSAPRDSGEQEADRLADAALSAPVSASSRSLGPDFSQVRLHSGSRAAGSARALNAGAYTVGNDIALGASQSRLDTPTGQRLLAHELAHTVQQTSMGQGAFVQRQSPPDLGVEETPAPGAQEEEKNYSVAFLSDTDRQEFRRRVGVNLSLAYTAFVSACKDNKQSLRDIAKRRSEWLAVFADVAMGFLAPGIARNLASRVTATTPEAQAAISRLILNTDLTKAAFQGATKAAGQYAKDKSLTLFGDTEVDIFIRNLESVYQTAFQQISDTLTERDDEELVALLAVYDSSVANVFEYSKSIRDLVAKFENQILRIGTDTTLVSNQGRVYYILFPDGRKGLALLGKRYGILGNFLGYSYLTGISMEMQELAIKRSLELFGTIDTVKREEVIGLPAGY
jgi:hypothetical protein